MHTITRDELRAGAVDVPGDLTAELADDLAPDRAGAVV